MKFDNETIKTTLNADFTEVKVFHFSHCLRENESLVQDFLTKAVNLEEVSLINSKAISDSTILTLATNCKQLTCVNLSRAMCITNNAIIQLSENCPNLTSINLSQCFRLRGDAALLAIIQNCQHMASFDLYYSEAATDSAILAIATHCGPNLKRLLLSGVSALHKQESILHLLERCPNILELSLNGCRNTVLTDLTINSIAEHCKVITSVCISDTRMLDDECINNLARNCIHITNLDISGLSLTIQSIHSIVHHLVSLRTIKFYQYNEDYENQNEGNDLHDAAFRVLATHFESFTVLNLCDCVVSGVPVDRANDSRERRDILPVNKKLKVDKVDSAVLPVNTDATSEQEGDGDGHAGDAEECESAEDPPFHAGSGCYGEDEDYQPGNLKAATITDKLAPKCNTLIEFHINSYCTVPDCMSVMHACDGSVLKVFCVFMLDLKDEHVMVIADKCHSLSTLKLEHIKSTTATSVCALIAANPALTDVTIRDCLLLEAPVVKNRAVEQQGGSNWFGGGMMFGGSLSKSNVYASGKSSGRIQAALSKNTPVGGAVGDGGDRSTATITPTSALGLGSVADGGGIGGHGGGFSFNFVIDDVWDASVNPIPSTDTGLSGSGESGVGGESGVVEWISEAPAMVDDSAIIASGIDECVLALAKHCPDLQSVDFSGSKSVTDARLSALAHGCHRLTTINVGRNRPHQISETTLRDFIQHCPALREIIARFESPDKYAASAASKYNVNSHN